MEAGHPRSGVRPLGGRRHRRAGYLRLVGSQTLHGRQALLVTPSGYERPVVDDGANAGYAAITAVILVFGGCTVQSLRDPCFFDPPPGDQLSRTIMSDSSAAVALIYCDDERCRRGYNEMTVDSGQATEVIIEGCSTETMAVADPKSHIILGCLNEPGDKLGVPDRTIGRLVTGRHECVGQGPFPFKIELYDPSK